MQIACKIKTSVNISRCTVYETGMSHMLQSYDNLV